MRFVRLLLLSLVLSVGFSGFVNALEFPVGSYEIARIYFLGSGSDTYAAPHVDALDPDAEPDECSSIYKYVCTSPKIGMGTACGGKYATPCVCPAGYNKDCSTDPALIGVGSSCDGKYQTCRCGYSYTQTCVGKYEGVGSACTLNAAAPLYQSCQCKPAYDKTCTVPYLGVGEACESKYQSCECPSGYSQICTTPNIGVGLICNGRYQSCQCDPSYTETCVSPKVGVGDKCNDKYQSCVCPAEFDKDADTCPAGTIPGGNECDGKYDQCLCNLDVYKYTCDGTDMSPIPGVAGCGGKYEDCLCGDSYIWDDITCYGDNKPGGEECGLSGKFNQCSCNPELFTVECDPANDEYGDGTVCEGKYKQCVVEKCPVGYSVDITSCGDGEYFITSGVVQGQNCGMCEVIACSSGFDLSLPACSASEELKSEKANDGVSDCYKCEAIVCSSADYTAGLEMSACDGINQIFEEDAKGCGKCTDMCNAGWTPNPTLTCAVDEYIEGGNGPFGNDCYRCAAIVCSSSDYAAGLTAGDCSDWQLFEEDIVAGCGKCSDKCNAGWTPYEMVMTNDCSSKTYPQGWEQVQDLQNGTYCYQCQAKTCSMVSAHDTTPKICSADQFLDISGYAGDSPCSLCMNICNTGWSKDVNSCTGPGEEFGSVIGADGLTQCGQCVYSGCISGVHNETTTAADCTSEQTFDLDATNCGRCIDKCPAGYNSSLTSVEDCGTSGMNGWSLQTMTGETGIVCGKCSTNPCPEGGIYSSINECGSSGSAGWEFGEITPGVDYYSGDDVCRRCDMRPCPDGQIVEGESCGVGNWEYVYGSTSMSGNKQCVTCGAMGGLCPSGYGYTEDDCGTGGAADWTLGAGNGQYFGADQCKLCVANACSDGFSTDTITSCSGVIETQGTSGGLPCKACVTSDNCSLRCYGTCSCGGSNERVCIADICKTVNAYSLTETQPFVLIDNYQDTFDEMILSYPSTSTSMATGTLRGSASVRHTNSGTITVNGTLWIGKEYGYATTKVDFATPLVVNGVIRLGNDSEITVSAPGSVSGSYTCERCTTGGGCVSIACPF